MAESQASDPKAPENPAQAAESQSNITMKMDPDIAKMLPDNLSKFVDTEGNINLTNIGKSDADHQRKITELSAAPKAPATDDPLAIKRAGTSGVESTLDQKLANIGHTRESVVKEYTENNSSLKDETYQKLASQGIDRASAELGCEGLSAKSALLDMKVSQALETARAEASGGVPGVDGESALKNLLQWAGTSGSMGQAEMDAVDDLVGNSDTTRIGVVLLKALHNNELGAGNAEPLLSGVPAAAGGAIQVTNRNYKEIKAKAMGGSSRHQQAILAAMNDGTLAKVLL